MKYSLGSAGGKAGRRAVKGTRCLLAFLFAAFSPGVVQAAPNQEWNGTVRDSAGVPIVQNPETGIWADETRWTLELDLALGGAEADSTQEFGEIVDVDAGSDGRIYVLDGRPVRRKLVYVFDADGAFVRAFGENGSGEGEVRGIAKALTASDAGTILVMDASEGTLFTPDGEPLGSFPLDSGEPWIDLRGGEYLQLSRRYRAAGAVTLVRRGSRGEVIDSVNLLTLSSPPIFGPMGRMLPLLPARALWDRTRAGRIISGVSDRYRIEVRTRDGELERVITKPSGDRARLSRFGEEQKRMAAQYFDQLRKRDERRGRDRDAADYTYTNIPLARQLPAFTELAGGPDGTIWVRGVLPIDSMFVGGSVELSGSASRTWEVYSRVGRLLGRISLPADLGHFTLTETRGTHIYGIEQDEMGVQRVVRLRIRRPAERSDTPGSRRPAR